MARNKDITKPEVLQGLVAKDRDLMQALVRQGLQQIMEAEMEEALGAGRGERTEGRLGFRSGYYGRRLETRVGTIALRVPQDRQGRFQTEVFERYQRSEKALVAALAEMYVQGVSTRKVAAITEQLCGHEFSASAVSGAVGRLEEDLRRFAERPLEEDYVYLFLDARYERVREDGCVRSQAVLVAVGVNREGRRCMLAVEGANRESASSWRDLLLGLKRRGLRGVRMAVSDAHDGLRQAIAEVLPEAVWQRCYVHFLRNALDYLPRHGAADCLTELRWLYERRDLGEARRDLAAWLAKWGARHPRLCAWVEEHIESTLSFYRLPQEHHKHLKSTNMLERLMQELKRRTLVIRIFPNTAACLRLSRALAVEMHEDWAEGPRYLNMEPLLDQRKEAAALATVA